MYKRLSILIIALASILCFSCKKTDLTPAYIEITQEDVNNCIDVSGFNETHDLNFDDEQLNALQQHTFTHINVYVNNKNLGCWPLPCKVPVLDLDDTDSSTLIILPAFRRTGMSNTVDGYPFLNVLRQKVMLKRGGTYHVSEHPLSYIYSPYASFPYLETFSNSTSFTPTDTANQITFNPMQYEGRLVGGLTLNDQNGLSFDVTSTNITVPVYNYSTYLEITYKTDNNMEVGMKLSTGYSSNTVHQLGGMYPTNGEWKTIYFELSSVIGGYHYTGSDLTTINLVLTGVGDKGKDTHYYIDNIKVVYIPIA